MSELILQENWTLETAYFNLKDKVGLHKKLTLEIVQELWFVRQEYSNRGFRSDLVQTCTKLNSFEAFCEAVGLSKRTAYSWLERFDSERQVLLTQDELQHRKQLNLEVKSKESPVIDSFDISSDEIESLETEAVVEMQIEKVEKLEKVEKTSNTQKKASSFTDEQIEEHKAWAEKFREDNKKKDLEREAKNTSVDEVQSNIDDILNTLEKIKSEKNNCVNNFMLDGAHNIEMFFVAVDNFIESAPLDRQREILTRLIQFSKSKIIDMERKQ